MLVTEKVGPVWLVTQQGEKTPVDNVPAVLWQGQGGMLGVFLSPHYATDHNVYLTYAEPGDGGSSLALARARLKLGAGTASLDGLQVLWRQMPKGRGGQFGAQIAFSPNGRYLFLTVGDRQRMTPAQDPNQALGKILRLTLDGKPAPGNPKAGTIGAASVPLIDPPHDTEMAKSAPVIRTYTFPEPNLARTLNRITFDGKGGATPAERWDIGHRVRDVEVGPDGALWLLEDANPGGLFRLTPK
jgi:glucose/arabinose dehydrogenase